MNLQAEIRPELWSAISKTYESENYKSSILEAIHYLSDTIREKSDLDGDGAQLVGAAFGGSAPILRINKFQTQSEKDEQKGLEQLLRGIYRGIRNPRSHEQAEDPRKTANAIIVFVDYLVGIIDDAREPFTVEAWSELVFDPHFVPSQNYVEELVSEIPPRRRLDTLIHLYQNKDISDADNLKLVFEVLIQLLNESSLEDFLLVVSDELRRVRDIYAPTTHEDEDIDFEHYMPERLFSAEAVIRCVLKILPPHLWPQIDTVARLRIENLLIESIRSGSYYEEKDWCSNGTLGTWARDFLEHFEEPNKKKFTHVILKKLRKEDNEIDYVFRYFFYSIPSIFTEMKRVQQAYAKAICNAATNSPNLNIVQERLSSGINDLPNTWADQIQQMLKRENYALYEKLFPLDEEIPF